MFSPDAFIFPFPLTGKHILAELASSSYSEHLASSFKHFFETTFLFIGVR